MNASVWKAAACAALLCAGPALAGSAPKPAASLTPQQAPAVQLPAEPGTAKKPPSSTRPRLFVRDLTAQGVEPAEAAALSDAVVLTLTERGLFHVISEKDVQTLISTERQRQLLGACPEDSADPSCAFDLSHALEAPFVMSGALSKVGSAYQLTLETVDIRGGKALARSARLAGDLATLTQLVPYAAAEATGSPLPPPRSRWAQYSMIGTGGGLVLGGAFYGLLALSREQALTEQICPGGPGANGACAGEHLGYLADVQRQGKDLARDKTVALGVMAGGALLVAGGILLLPPPEAGPRIAIVPTSRGVAFAGVFW